MMLLFFASHKPLEIGLCEYTRFSGQEARIESTDPGWLNLGYFFVNGIRHIKKKDLIVSGSAKLSSLFLQLGLLYGLDEGSKWIKLRTSSTILPLVPIYLWCSLAQYAQSESNKKISSQLTHGNLVLSTLWDALDDQDGDFCVKKFSTLPLDLRIKEADVVSFSTITPRNPSLIRSLADQGIPCAVAVGNQAQDISLPNESRVPFKDFLNAYHVGKAYSVAFLPEVVVVGAYDPDTEMLQPYSSFVPPESLAHFVVAPTYSSEPGTSFAAPKVAAALAKLKSRYPRKTGAELIETLLMKTRKPFWYDSMLPFKDAPPPTHAEKAALLISWIEQDSEQWGHIAPTAKMFDEMRRQMLSYKLDIVEDGCWESESEGEKTPTESEASDVIELCDPDLTESKNASEQDPFFGNGGEAPDKPKTPLQEAVSTTMSLAGISEEGKSERTHEEAEKHADPQAEVNAKGVQSSCVMS